MPDEAKNALNTVLRAHKKAFLVWRKGEDEVKISWYDNFGLASDVLVSILNFGMTMLDKNVIFVIIGLIPVESELVLPLEIGGFPYILLD